MKIGLVGEAPNDTTAIKNLLEKKYRNDEFSFFFMLQNFNGSNLDSQKTKRFLRIEFETEKPDIVIFIRDLDSTWPNKNQYYKRQEYFSDSNSVVDKKGIFLLNIYEIEALILADIETFNSIYSTSIAPFPNVMIISEPKELLENSTKKYCISDNPEIFEKINFDNVLNCIYFNNFIKKFNRKISVS